MKNETKTGFMCSIKMPKTGYVRCPMSPAVLSLKNEPSSCRYIRGHSLYPYFGPFICKRTEQTISFWFINWQELNQMRGEVTLANFGI